MSKMKLKTNKAAKKRFHISGTKKILKRKAGQSHFNSRDTGVRTMGKRRDVQAHKTLTRNITRLVPSAS